MPNRETKPRLTSVVTILKKRVQQTQKGDQTFAIYECSDGNEYTCWEDDVREIVEEGYTYQFTYTRTEKDEKIYLNVVAAGLRNVEGFDPKDTGPTPPDQRDTPPKKRYPPPKLGPLPATPNGYTKDRSIQVDVAFKGAVEIASALIKSSGGTFYDLERSILRMARVFDAGMEAIKNRPPSKAEELLEKEEKRDEG